jgi:hypothetical protein
MYLNPKYVKPTLKMVISPVISTPAIVVQTSDLFEPSKIGPSSFGP